MAKTVLCALMLAATAFGQYKLESAGAPPSDLAPAVRDVLQKDGAKILGPDGSVYCEVWLRTNIPAGAGSTEMGVTLTMVPHGALLGAVRFPSTASDRRGQSIKPGVYTLRYSLYPPDGNHQGVALQRDFFHLLPAATDKDPNSLPSFEELMAISKKARGGMHPYVLSLWKDDAGHPLQFVQEGEDWVLYSKIGNVPIGMILVGTYSG